MNYPQKYVDYLIHFHGDRDYFECHELLEEHWKSSPNRERLWVGLIQLAVGMYHYRRNNHAGAKKMLSNSLAILRQKRTEVASIGLDAGQLILLLEETLQHVHSGKPYQSINLPITDDHLLALCQSGCKQTGLYYGEPSDCNNLDLLNRHMLRDRSEVIAERQRQLEIKQKQRSSQ